MLLLMLACGSEAPGTYTLSVSPAPELPSKLVLAGEGVALSIPLVDGQAQAELPGGVRLSGVTGTVEFEAPCGTQSWPVEWSHSASLEDRTRESGEPYSATALPKPAGDVYAAWHLWVDPALGEIRVGDLAVAVPADGRVSVYRPQGCAPQVKAGELELGTLEARNGQWLIASPQACYSHMTIAYGSSAATAPTQLLQGQGVYALQQDVSFFLKPAPDSVWSDQHAEQRGQLTRVACP